MAYLEATVVVYLRKLYYPEGFHFPLKMIPPDMIIIELFREGSTILMILAVAFLAGRGRWERFAYFALIFGVWDIFYYVWLKATIDWPSSLFEWDILFLIPLPWIGPVIAPVSIALLLIIACGIILYLSSLNIPFKPPRGAYGLSIGGTLIVLYSFMKDTGATLHQQMPQPYRYDLLFAGDILFIISIIWSLRSSLHRG